MPTELSPVLTQAPMVDRDTLRVTVPWQRWFAASWRRQGGHRARTNTELESDVGGNSASITTLETGLTTTNSTVAGLETEVTALQQAVLDLQAAVTTLQTAVPALTTRVQALEDWRAAIVAALPAVVAVTPVPTLGDAPATADVLRDELTTNWQGALTTSDEDLETAVNAIRAALAA